ncbi:class I SAM-dependent methyltransferase [Actinomadura logoneensis]|uniref:Class I SAM-dependent methyltransferase n=1 Tax=Actinomadura logoneensis TaxID=2293572 RepID=A0A372JPU7_9ACTN|nr:class I SAM-dependent methyltransferase [Actinomadura logoneensis]RFU41348.1 class I SAM-dependent methyltransferase [Actinomadura logoneensis]
MNEQTFTPALGRLAPARFFDPVVALTRERLWRALAVMHVAPRPGELVVDVGCGTGATALMVSRAEPRARVVAVDPDESVLAIARRKAAVSGADIRWETGMGDALPGIVGEGAADAVVSTLVLHQCPMETKRAVLAAMRAVLRPGGKAVIADYGLQRTPLMRLGFRLVQLADGVEDTRPNAEGVLPGLMAGGGFLDVREAEVVSTVTGSISVYTAVRG